MDVHPTKNVSIGIDPYPYQDQTWFSLKLLRDLRYFTEVFGAIELEKHTGKPQDVQ